MLYKIHKDDLHNKEIDDVSQFFSFDVHVTEKNQIIETPIPAKVSPNELIIEDELDEFLREFESHDETLAEKAKSPLEMNENVKDVAVRTSIVNGNLKEISKNEDLKIGKENNSDLEHCDFFDKESYYHIKREGIIQESPGIKNFCVKKDDQIVKSEKDQLIKKISENDYLTLKLKNSPKNEKQKQNKQTKSLKLKTDKNDKIKEKTMNMSSLKETEFEYKIKKEVVDEINVNKIGSSKDQEAKHKVSKNYTVSQKLEDSKLYHHRKKTDTRITTKCEEVYASNGIQNINIKTNRKIPTDKLENEIKTLEKDFKQKIKRLNKEEGELDSDRSEQDHNSPHSQTLKKFENKIKPVNNEMEIGDLFISENHSLDNDNDNFNMMEKLFGSPTSKYNNSFMIDKNIPDMSKHPLKYEEEKAKNSCDESNKNANEFEDSLSEELFGTPIRPIKKEVNQESYKIEHTIKEITKKPEENKEKPKSSLENEFKIKKRKENPSFERKSNSLQNRNDDNTSKASSITCITRHKVESLQVFYLIF